jgi:hypothetical protein
MMIRFIALICVLVLAAGSLAAEKKEAKPDAALLKAQSVLTTALKDLDPNLTFSYDRNPPSLVVRYQTRKFMVHGRSKIGKVSEKAHETEGPSYKGFLMRIYLEERGQIRAAVIPQTLRQPYWDTDLNIVELPGDQKQLYWTLSYGVRAPVETKKKIRLAMESLGKKPKRGKGK